MLTPQDIQEQEFSKAVFGGYDMTGVDDFLEQVGEDYAALYKDNAVLKGKLKVLVDKVEEYRSTEDSMRMALLTAQRMSDDMLAETKEKCDAMLREAETGASGKAEKLRKEIANEEKRLEAAKRETAKFVAAARALGMKHQEFLSKIGEITADFDVEKEPARAPEPKPAPAKPQKTEEAPTKDAFVNGLMPESEEPNLDETRRVPDLSQAMKDAKKEWTEEDEELTPRPKFKFDDLQFGKKYTEGK